MFLLIFTGLFTFGAKAQLYKHSIGFALGTPLGVQYKGALSSNNAIDIVLGTIFNGVTVTGAYEWVFPVKGARDFQWFVGPAASIGAWDHDHDDGVFFAVYGGGGIEYKFNEIPLVLSFDLFPIGVSFIENSGYDFQCRAGIRYTF